MIPPSSRTRGTLAAYRCLPRIDWLLHADPVPHSWDATSDSIAAWIAVTLRAAHLVLIKPAPGAPHDMTDAHFGTILAAASTAPCVSVCTAQTLARVMESLRFPGNGM